MTMGESVDKYDLVIVDEDIIFNSIIPNKSDISVSTLKKLRRKLEMIAANDPLAAKVRKILKHIRTGRFFTLAEVPYDKAYDAIPMAVDIASLCAAVHFCYREVTDKDSDIEEDCVSYVIPVKFSPNTKFIMVSATVDEEICGYYFGDNMSFYECKMAKNTGNLNQYYGWPMSRAYIYKDPGIIKRLKEWSGFADTISFKTFMKYYHGDLHFGNCAGCDDLKGHDLDVIGTPHQPQWIYKLFAFSLDRGIDIKAEMKPGVRVTHNGYIFRFTSFEDESLRAIQLYMIESQSEQAVGRSRLLREKCTVNLFSNFPLRQAVMIADFPVSDHDKESAAKTDH
jgi:hypothetical protein